MTGTATSVDRAYLGGGEVASGDGAPAMKSPGYEAAPHQWGLMGR